MAKLRTSKQRQFRITPEAAARYRELGPGWVDTCVADALLADLLGLPYLINYPAPTMAALREALDDAD